MAAPGQTKPAKHRELRGSPRTAPALAGHAQTNATHADVQLGAEGRQRTSQLDDVCADRTPRHVASDRTDRAPVPPPISLQRART
jgi:hypothetical protein